jgi:hypothetical protein
MPKKRRSKPSWLLTSLWTGAETHSLTKSHVRIFSESTRRCVTPGCSDRTVANKHGPAEELPAIRWRESGRPSSHAEVEEASRRSIPRMRFGKCSPSDDFWNSKG